MLQDWTIQARAHRCDVTGQPFAEGEFFYTLLYRDGGGEALSRRDVSAEGWKRLRADRSAPRPFSFWRSRFTPPPPAPDPFPKADAETRLRAFLADPRPEHTRAVYILALMLERKKVLRPTDTRTDGDQRLLFYEHARSGETFVVTDPGLRLDQLEEVQREVGELLKTPDAPAPAA